MRRAFLLLALLLLGSCGGGRSIAEVDLLVAVDVGTRSVATGEGFLLTVTRIWRKDIEPSPWDDGVLSPLVVRAEGVRTREDRLRVEEVRTFRAYAFGLEPITVPPVLCVGRSVGGSGRVLARSEAVELDVRPTLPAENPGEPELPDVPGAEHPRSSWWWGLGVALLIALFAWAIARGRGRGTLEEQPPDALERARRELRALLQSGGAAALVLGKGSDCVRRAVAHAYGLSTVSKTTEEVLTVVPAERRAALRAVLDPADLAKFAAWEPETATRREVLASMLAFVESLESPAGGGGTT